MNLPDIINQITPLRKAGCFVVVWTPDEVKGLDNEDLEELEDRVVTRGNEFIEECQNRTEEDDEDEDDTCPTCQGCGEGMYDGASCSTCGGSGVIRPKKGWKDE